MSSQQIAETPAPTSPAELQEMLHRVEEYNRSLEGAMVPPDLTEGITSLQQALLSMQGQLNDMVARLNELSVEAEAFAVAKAGADHGDFWIIGLTVFVLAVFVGYHVVWRVTPALHSPLMSVTNAISSVIIVGGLIAAGPSVLNFSTFMGFLAIVLASINIFGGFIVTNRMLSMYKKKK